MSRRNVMIAGLLLGIAVTAWWRIGNRRAQTLVLWTDVRGGGALRIALDGRYVGSLTSYFSAGAPDCTTERGVLRVSLRRGTYNIYATDEAGRAWTQRISAGGRSCAVLRLAPHGSRSGGATIPADSGA